MLRKSIDNGIMLNERLSLKRGEKMKLKFNLTKFMLRNEIDYNYNYIKGVQNLGKQSLHMFTLINGGKNKFKILHLTTYLTPENGLNVLIDICIVYRSP